MECENKMGVMQITCEARHLQSQDCHTADVCCSEAKDYLILSHQ